MNIFYKGLKFLNNLFKNLIMPKSKYTKLKKKSGRTGKGKSYTYKKKRSKK